MKSLLFTGAALFCLGGSLATDYTQKRSLRVEISSNMEMELKSMSVERDGQPVEVPAMSMNSTSKRTIAFVDTTLEHEDGAPKKVRRVFESLANENATSFGERQMESAMKPRLEGVTLELTRGDDGVEVKVVEGEAEGDALEGHQLTLLLDAFLPKGDEKEWELDNAAIQRGLALDVQKALFAPPEQPEGGGEDGGRRRGPRGGSQVSGVLSMATLEGQASLAEEPVDHGGVACKAIKLEIKGSGDMPMPEGRGPREGRLFDPAPPLVLLGNTYDIELEGQLLFDPNTKLPVLLKLEGSIEIQQSSERTFNDSTMKQEMTMGGELEFEVEISKTED
jgi:hypothetical protein